MNTKTYSLPRDLFLGVFVDVFGQDNMDIYLSRMWRIAIDEFNNHVVGDFVITWIEETNRWYLTHLPSHTVISWKMLDNIGKENCMSHELTPDDLTELVTQLKICLDMHKFQRV